MCQNKFFPAKIPLEWENGGCQNQNFADEPNTFYPENLATTLEDIDTLFDFGNFSPHLFCHFAHRIWKKNWNNFCLDNEQKKLIAIIFPSNRTLCLADIAVKEMGLNLKSCSSYQIVRFWVQF